MRGWELNSMNRKRKQALTILGWIYFVGVFIMMFLLENDTKTFIVFLSIFTLSYVCWLRLLNQLMKDEKAKCSCEQ